MDLTTTIYSVELIEKIQIAKDTIQLRTIKPENFVFQAGQYLQWILLENENKILRSYSLSSTPQDNFLEFCIKLLPDGKIANFVKKINIGEKINFQGPLGKFVITNDSTDLCFFCTGTGLVPVYSIVVDQLINKKSNRKISLYFGIRLEENLFWLERLNNLKKKFSNFDFKIAISQAEDKYPGFKGRISQYLSEAANEPRNREFYLCGNIEMVKEIKTGLRNLGVMSAVIKYEIY